MPGILRHLYGILNLEPSTAEGYFLLGFFKGYDNAEVRVR